MASYITVNRGRYTFSFGIPERHRAIAKARWPDEFRGATHVKVALGTSDHREAAQRAAPLVIRWSERMKELEAGAATWEKARADLAGDGFHFHERPDPQFAALTSNVVLRAARQRYAAAKERLLASMPANVKIDADAALSPERERLEAWSSGIAAALEPHGGPPPPKSAGKGVTFDDAVKTWKSYVSPAVGTQKQVAGVAKRWAEKFGAARDITTITKRDILAWQQSMLEGGDVTPQRINVILAYAGGVLSAAESADLIESNPTRGVRKLAPAGDGRDAFTPAEVKLLLRYADSMPDQRGAWLLRLGCYTGARLREIEQLRRSDVAEIDGVFCINITDRDGKTTKNKGSVRAVPVHKNIADKLRAYLKSADDRPFKVLGDPSNVMGDTITKAGVRRDGVVFHSLRHSFKNFCREAEIPEEIHDALTGHAGGGVGRRYGGKPPLRVLADAVDRLRIPTV